MQWFESWFDSPYYHLLYGKRDEKEAGFFIDNLLKKLNLPSKARCWDLNCGKGRHSVFLNKKGYEVIGTDLSEESIKYALQFENEHLHFYRHDMRNLFYANYFDAVFNLFTSFGYFRNKFEDEKVFQSVYNALKPGGTFVLDFFNAAQVLTCLRELEEKNINGVTFTLKKKIENNTIIKEITVNDNGKISLFKEEVKIFTHAELVLLGEQAGLTFKNTFGNYNLDTFVQDKSERLILIFEK
ncbi:MAG: class I SAM-dependent methyltransferase [Bacteroidia bacterium]